MKHDLHLSSRRFQTILTKNTMTLNQSNLKKHEKDEFNKTMAKPDRVRHITRELYLRTSSTTEVEKSIYYSGTIFRLHIRNQNRNRLSRKLEISRRILHFERASAQFHDLKVNTATSEARQNTFLDDWPLQIGKWWPRMYAEAGFFYLHTALDIQCHFCKIKTSVSDWFEKETPSQAHARISPKCFYVISKGYKPLTEEDQNRSQIIKEIKQLKEIKANEDLTQPDSTLTQQSSEQDIQSDNKDPPVFSGGGNIQGMPINQSISVQNGNLANGFNSELKHSLQTVTDSMNSQLTMDACHPRPREPEYKYPQYKECAARKRTFINWRFPQKQTPESLSKAGYFYTGENDIVRCFCCDLGLAEWDPKDDPWMEHARHNPRCWFLKTEKGQEFIQKIQQDWRKIYNPKHAAFDDKESRIATFDDWRTDIEQTPQILAEAGFFYTGEEDVVRCHYCDGGLRHWEPGDIPWEEHARWFPFCKFVIKMKGRQYIEEIKIKTEERQRAAQLPRNTNTQNTANYDVNHPIIKKIQSYGIPQAEINKAANEFVRRNGGSHFKEEELMKLIFDKDNQQTQRNHNTVQSILTADTPQERDPEKILETNRKLKEKLKCVRCRNNDICMLFVNCGHRLTCETCAHKMDFCPHCDKRIKKRLKTFLS